ncbi:MAG: PAS domain S-box protein [Alkalinema sp. RL_2_19]|nr:PAS domain S-box protein [Alkalinema sp. RL_2_19]
MICRNISEQKQARDALRQAEHKYRTMFEEAPQGIYQSTIAGRYLNVNPALARIYGYDSPATLMAQIDDIGTQVYCLPERRQIFIQQMNQYGEVRGFESAVKCLDGSEIWIAENARSVCDADGNFLYYEGAVTDITARKQAELALRQQTERDRLMAAMTLRIRQSLNLQDIFASDGTGGASVSQCRSRLDLSISR